jgi:hypothetical protein
VDYVNLGKEQLPSKQIFGGGAGNLKTTSGVGAVRGVVVADNQLIVADLERLMFWNDPASLTNGKAADGVAGKTIDASGRSYGCCWVMKADKNHNLWVAVDGYGSIQRHIDIYRLPLTNGAQPYQTIFFPLPVLGGGQISSFSTWGMVPTDNSDFLWITDSDNSRVFRVRNPLTNPVIDVILGQTDATGTQCNRNLGAPPAFLGAADSLCYPGSLSLDRLGNLYVSDQSLEIRGNARLLEFNKDLFPANNATVIYAPAASKIFPNIATWEPAFNSLNQMVVGYNGYGPNPGKAVRFPGVYPDPLGAATSPKSFLNDFYSIPFAATFDDNDNLYVGDGIRARVLIYKKPNLNYTCPNSFPNDKFHACFYHTTDPAAGPLIGERDEGVVSSPAPANATPIYHDYGGGGEYGEVDNFSGVWWGNINFPAGTYKFKVTVDNGVRLDIGDDGTYEIDDWNNNPPRTLYTSPISLNGYTKIRLEWFETANLASVIFGWTVEQAPIGVAITSPAADVITKGTVTVLANASGGTGVTKIEFYDGVTKIGEDLTPPAPFSISWDTTTVSNGNHSLTAKAYDNSGNVSTSSAISITIDNQPPTAPTGLTATAVAYNQVNLAWNASSDNVAIAGYWIVRDGTITIASSKTNN